MAVHGHARIAGKGIKWEGGRNCLSAARLMISWSGHSVYFLYDLKWIASSLVGRFVCIEG